MSDDIAAWLTAIWDEDEAAEGRKFRSRKGVPQPESIMHGWPEDDQVTIRRPGSDSETVLMTMDYFAEFCEPNPDPFTLARIAADRQILVLHKPDRPPSTEDDDWGHRKCEGCGWQIDIGDDSPTWCPTVRLLALPHADRPGYQEAWRP